MRWLKKFIGSLSPGRLIIYSFVFIISIGTFLLYLPISRRGGSANFIDVLFTAVSCTCVTGLSVHDTWSYYTLFGQVIVLVLIQVGALGLISFTAGFTMMLHKKLRFRDIKIVQEGTQGEIVDIPKIVKTVFACTSILEVFGALLLALKFIPKFGWLKGAWLSIFLAISSYCNAGFEVTGFISPDSGIMPFNGEPFITVVLSALTIIGGLGFLTMIDISSHIRNKLTRTGKVKRLSLQTRIVLNATFWLLLVGTALFFCFEYENTLNGLSFWQKLSVSFMQSASSRTSGLMCCDLNRQYNITKLITMVLMFIGASPVSTGGGIKTVSLVVLLATMWNTMCGHQEVVIKHKKINKSLVYRSVSIWLAFVVFIAVGTLMISILEAHKPIFVIDVLYEVVSAVSTTGFSVGVTRMVSDFSKCVLMFLMFIGRVGPISLILAITAKKDDGFKMIPEGKLMIS